MCVCIWVGRICVLGQGCIHVGGSVCMCRCLCMFVNASMRAWMDISHDSPWQLYLFYHGKDHVKDDYDDYVLK